MYLCIMNIKKVIKEKGFTSTKVAEVMGITTGGMSQLIKGNPTVGTLQRIADVIGCKVGDFFRDEIELPEPEAKEYAVGVCPHCGKPVKICVGLDKAEADD